MKRSAISTLLIFLVAVLSWGLGFCLEPQHARAGEIRVSNRPHGTPTTVTFIPKQAPFVASSLASPQELAQTWLALSTSKGSGRSTSSLLDGSGLTYGKDIQPWLGNEVTFAVTTPDIDRDRSNGQQPGYLVVLSTQNPEKSQAFLQLLWQKQAVPSEAVQVETYQGMTLTYQDDTLITAQTSAQPKKSQRSPLFSTLATASIGNRYILVANHPKVLRDAINNAQAPNLSLGSSAEYETAVKTLSDEQWGWIFVNLPELGEWSQWAEPLKAPSVVTGVSPYRLDKVAIALRSRPGGIAADTLFLAAPEKTVDAFNPPLNPSTSLLNYLPPSSALELTGLDLTQLQTALSTELQGYPALLSILEQPQRAFEKQTKTQLFNTILPWVKGEYGLAMVPTSNPLKPDWVFVAERSPEIEPALATLNDVAQQQGYTVVNLDVAGQPITTWTQLQPSTAKTSDSNLQAQIGAAHATVGNYELFATSVEAMKTALTSTPTRSRTRADQSLYKRAIAPLPNPNAGYVYVEWEPTRPLLENALPLIKWIDWSAPSLFNNLKTLTFSTSPSESGTRRSLLFVQFS